MRNTKIRRGSRKDKATRWRSYKSKQQRPNDFTGRYGGVSDGAKHSMTERTLNG